MDRKVSLTYKHDFILRFNYLLQSREVVKTNTKNITLEFFYHGVHTYRTLAFHVKKIVVWEIVVMYRFSLENCIYIRNVFEKFSCKIGITVGFFCLPAAGVRQSGITWASVVWERMCVCFVTRIVKSRPHKHCIFDSPNNQSLHNWRRVAGHCKLI